MRFKDMPEKPVEGGALDAEWVKKLYDTIRTFPQQTAPRLDQWGNGWYYTTTTNQVTLNEPITIRGNVV